jgi:hypothetical protein
MPSEILEKIEKLSPALKARLSDEQFLNKLDRLEEQYGIKAVLILLSLLLKELSYENLEEHLITQYNFNSPLAEKIKSELGALILELEEVLEVQPLIKEEIQTAPQSVNTPQPLKEKPPEVKNEVTAKFSTGLTFSREDQEEIKKYQPINSTNQVDYEAVADEVTAGFVFAGKDEALTKRLKNIIVARIKGVRDDLEAKDVLTKSRLSGGLEFSSAEADSLLKIIKEWTKSGRIPDLSAVGLANYNPNIKKANSPIEKKPATNISPSTLTQTSAQPSFEEEDGLPVIKLPQDVVAVDDFLPMEQEEENKKNNGVAKILPLESKNGKIETVPKGLIEVKVKTEEKKLPEIVVTKNTPTIPINNEPTPQAKPLPYVSDKKIPDTVINNKNPQKPSLDDVKFFKQTFGPIEELENMSIIEFRRIAADPQVIIRKIKEKIDLLEEQGFSKKMEGISAWHKSEVNRFYRLLGQTSMSEGKPIEEIIRTRLFAGKPTLSLDEFEAVMELNRQLRF